MKKRLLFALLFISYISAFSQDQDSITFARAKWHKENVESAKLVTYNFNEKDLFAANQQISYIEVKPKDKKLIFDIGADEKMLIATSDFGKTANATAAINGTFFDIKNGGSVDFVKKDGKVINTTRLEKNGARARHQQAAIIIDNGKLSIEKWDGTADWEEKLAAEDVMLTGPLLTFNHVDEVLDTTAFTKGRNPRTCVGIKPDGKVLLLTVDGRNENSAGMSLPELAKIMRWLGCTTSINLDGGGSTTLWVAGFPDGGVVNYPSDNKKWDHEGQRKVANVILLKKNQ